MTSTAQPDTHPGFTGQANPGAARRAKIMRWIATAAATVLVMGGLTGCSSSGSGGPSCDEACRRNISAANSGIRSASSPSVRPNGLTGYGATLTEWNAHHQADRNYDPGCCYGPQVKAPDNGGTASQWNLAANTGDTVLEMTESFAPNTSEADVLSQIESGDLARDAAQAPAQGDGPCELKVYTSATLKAANPDASPVEVALYSSLDGTSYDPADVERVIFSPGDGSGGC